MTQALNLANFANNLNTSGQTSNSGLQNSSVTVTAGTGMSGGGAVALGSSVTLTNAGVTSVTAGTGISVSASTGAVTISSSGGAGTVTSVATGNGLSGGTITTSGTLTLACPSSGSVGSYAIVSKNTWQPMAGNTYSGMTGRCWAPDGGLIDNGPATSGTWRVMGSNADRNDIVTILCCRVS